MGKDRAFVAASKTTVLNALGTKTSISISHLAEGAATTPMLAAPSGSAPIRIGRQRYLTGIGARRSAKDLAPFRTLENAV